MKLIIVMCLIISSSLVLAQSTDTKKKKKTKAKKVETSSTKTTTPPTVLEVKPTQVKKKTIKDYFGINYFGVFEGPTASQFGSLDFHNRRTDKDGDDSGAKGGNYLQWDHQFSFLGKKAVGNMDFVANVRIRTTTNPANQVIGRDFRTGLQGMLYQGKKAGFWARFDVDLPTSTASKRDKLIASPGWLLDYFYAVNDCLTLGGMHFLKAPLYENTTLADGSDIDHLFQWVAPYVTYKFNDTFDFMGIYNFEYSNFMQNDNHLHFKQVYEVVQLGFNIRVGGGWTVYPALMLDTFKNADTYNTNLMGVQIWLFGPVF